MNRCTIYLLSFSLMVGCDGVSSNDRQAPAQSADQNEQPQSARGSIEQQSPDMTATASETSSPATEIGEPTCCVTRITNAPNQAMV